MLAVTWLFEMTSLLSVKRCLFTETSMSVCSPAESATASPTVLVMVAAFPEMVVLLIVAA